MSYPFSITSELCDMGWKNAYPGEGEGLDAMSKMAEE